MNEMFYQHTVCLTRAGGFTRKIFKGKAMIFCVRHQDCSNNVVKTILNHPWLGMVYITYIKMVIWGMVYDIVLTTLPQIPVNNLHR